MKTQFADTGYWDSLAHERGIRLPHWGTALKGKQRRWLTKLGIAHEEYKEHFNEPYSTFARLNPTWPLRSWVGLMLEWLLEREQKPQLALKK